MYTKVKRVRNVCQSPYALNFQLSLEPELVELQQPSFWESISVPMRRYPFSNVAKSEAGLLQLRWPELRTRSEAVSFIRQIFWWKLFSTKWVRCRQLMTSCNFRVFSTASCYTFNTKACHQILNFFSVTPNYITLSVDEKQANVSVFVWN